MNNQDWFPLGLTGWISLQSKGLSRVFSSTTIWKDQFFGAQPSLWWNSHIHAWLHDMSLQSCPTLCDLMECSLPGTPVHGILQARILKWMAMPSSRGSSQPRDRTCISYVSCIGRWVLYHQCHLGSPHTSLCFPKSIHLKIWQTWTKQLAVWVVKLKVLQKQFPITSYKPDGPNIQFYVYPLCFMEMWL